VRIPGGDQFDVVIVGGGPAGLAAALWLGRYRRTVLVVDTERPRNERAWAVHGFPGIIDPSPLELRRVLREQAEAAGANYLSGRVAGVHGSRNRFTAHIEGGAEVRARRIVLAYGLRDRLPEVPGLDELYGTCAFHCPDCDGPSVAGGAAGVIGWDRHAAALALYLLTWTPRVSLLLHGRPAGMDEKASAALAQQGIRVHDPPIRRIESVGGTLSGCVLQDDSVVPLDALFFHLGADPADELAGRLGCERDARGFISVDESLETSVRGVYAAGDLTGPPHLAVHAAAEGVRVALVLHRSLLPPDFEV
jgi:thioredoxin reductase